MPPLSHDSIFQMMFVNVQLQWVFEYFYVQCNISLHPCITNKTIKVDSTQRNVFKYKSVFIGLQIKQKLTFSHKTSPNMISFFYDSLKICKFTNVWCRKHKSFISLLLWSQRLNKRNIKCWKNLHLAKEIEYEIKWEKKGKLINAKKRKE